MDRGEVNRGSGWEFKISLVSFLSYLELVYTGIVFLFLVVRLFLGKSSSLN